jgi:hypothetical protein
MHINRTASQPQPSTHDWIQIVRGEFLEIPGLQLLRPQIQRFWGLDDRLCNCVLAALTDTGFLAVKPDGHFVRADIHRPSLLPHLRANRLQ